MTTNIQRATANVLRDLYEVMPLSGDDLLVFGVSTSEVLGQQIGTAGSEDVAGAIFNAVESFRQAHDCHVAFQCCEHLNRALVTQRRTLKQFGLTEVTVVPAPQAGGSMAAHVYRQWPDAVMVESVQAQAHAGVDIGDTFIGMHLRAVAVPVRPSVKTIGQAHVSVARTRPKLIGGSRAVYP